MSSGQITASISTRKKFPLDKSLRGFQLLNPLWRLRLTYLTLVLLYIHQKILLVNILQSFFIRWIISQKELPFLIKITGFKITNREETILETLSKDFQWVVEYMSHVAYHCRWRVFLFLATDIKLRSCQQQHHPKHPHLRWASLLAVDISASPFYLLRYRESFHAMSNRQERRIRRGAVSNQHLSFSPLSSVAKNVSNLSNKEWSHSSQQLQPARIQVDTVPP